MKKIYLHIGFHKTGTSALQEYLNENREELISNNIFYPKSFENKYPGNVDLSWAFNSQPPAWGNVTEENKEKILEFYKNQIDNTKCSNIIISSEDFVLLDSEHHSIEKIKDFFKEYDVSIIVYVREPIDFILSLYSHAVRARTTSLSFKEYIAMDYSFRSADYPIRLQPWKKIFGEESLIVKKYAPKSFLRDSLVSDFFDAIKLDISIKVKIKKSNVGVHPWLIQPYIEIASSDLDEGIKIRKLKKLSILGEGLPKENAVKYFLDSEDLAILNNIYKVMKNRLKREYGIEFD